MIEFQAPHKITSGPLTLKRALGCAYGGSMSAAEPHEQRRAPDLSRVPIATSAIICGAMAIACVLAAGYAYLSTPEIVAIPIVVDHITTTESKFQYLLAPPLFSIILFCILAYYAFRWSEVSRKIVNIANSYKDRVAILRNINISTLYGISCILFCIYQAGTLLIGIHKSIVVINELF